MLFYTGARTSAVQTLKFNSFKTVKEQDQDVYTVSYFEPKTQKPGLKRIDREVYSDFLQLR